MSNATFTAARVQGRYRVLDEAGQIVVTLNSKAKAEARAAELNELHAPEPGPAAVEAEWDAMVAATVEVEAEEQEPTTTVEEAIAEAEEFLARRVEADVAMEQEMDEECPQEDDEPVIVRAGEIAPLVQDEPMQEEPRDEFLSAEESAALIDAALGVDEPEYQAELDAQAAVPAAEEPQEAPKAEAKPKAPKMDQPAPHAFSTVGTTIKNHCASCGRSWAAASHRKFRAQQAEAVVPVEAEEEWTPAEDDTTETGKAPAEEAQTVAV